MGNYETNRPGQNGQSGKAGFGRTFAAAVFAATLAFGGATGCAPKPKYPPIQKAYLADPEGARAYGIDSKEALDEYISLKTKLLNDYDEGEMITVADQEQLSNYMLRAAKIWIANGIDKHNESAVLGTKPSEKVPTDAIELNYTETSEGPERTITVDNNNVFSSLNGTVNGPVLEIIDYVARAQGSAMTASDANQLLTDLENKMYNNDATFDGEGFDGKKVTREIPKDNER